MKRELQQTVRKSKVSPTLFLQCCYLQTRKSEGLVYKTRKAREKFFNKYFSPNKNESFSIARTILLRGN